MFIRVNSWEPKYQANANTCLNCCIYARVIDDAVAFNPTLAEVAPNLHLLAMSHSSNLANWAVHADTSSSQVAPNTLVKTLIVLHFSHKVLPPPIIPVIQILVYIFLTYLTSLIQVYHHNDYKENLIHSNLVCGKARLLFVLKPAYTPHCSYTPLHIVASQSKKHSHNTNFKQVRTFLAKWFSLPMKLISEHG